MLAAVLLLMPALAAAQSAEPPAAAESATSSQPPQKGIAGKTLDAAKTAARRAGDILTRVPCLSAKGAAAMGATLPRVARKLNARAPVTIVALGSSSTQGYGSSSPAYNYPNRLAAQLRRKYPHSEINVINRGIGGQEVPEMVARLQSSVLDAHPDLVIWQLGTNSVVRGNDNPNTAALVEDGVSRIQAAGADVVLIDPQYAPAVTAKKEGASRMVKRHWHEDEKMPFDAFVTADGLHMNDWGYACFAQLLGDTIIRSVGQLKAGADMPGYVMSYRPM
jgi:lysophospholipase L1-like esterase